MTNTYYYLTADNIDHALYLAGIDLPGEVAKLMYHELDAVDAVILGGNGSLNTELKFDIDLLRDVLAGYEEYDSAAQLADAIGVTELSYGKLCELIKDACLFPARYDGAIIAPTGLSGELYVHFEKLMTFITAAENETNEVGETD